MGVELVVGALIAGRYQLDGLLGAGGMGAVWSATHTITKKRVALKFVRGLDAHRPEVVRRFLSEARTASAVEHPNVVEVFDVFELDGTTPVMVMEMLQGETLRAKLEREHAISLQAAAAILHPIVSAVAAAHELGIVHRDLKPENILLAQVGSTVVPKVLDFGIAKLTVPDGDPDSAVVTGSGALLGTPCYMAPEQGFGEKDIDLRADVWALGVILYECLSGARPIDGENLGQFLKRLMSDAITPLQMLEPDLPDEVTGLVGRMLSRDRNDRPSTLAEVLDVLGRILAAPADADSASGAARARAALTLALAPTYDSSREGEGPLSGSQPRESVAAPGSRRPAMFTALAVGALAVAIAIAASTTFSSGPAADSHDRAAPSISAAIDTTPLVPAATGTPPVPTPPSSAPVTAPSPPVDTAATSAPSAPSSNATRSGPIGPAASRSSKPTSDPTTPPPEPPPQPTSSSRPGGLVQEPPF